MFDFIATIAATIGWIKLIGYGFELFSFVYRHFMGYFGLQTVLRQRLRTHYRKDENTWAVVTGASDGLGAEYCRQLASEGFNIALVSRTMSKL